jgi:hypothetical protein
VKDVFPGPNPCCVQATFPHPDSLCVLLVQTPNHAWKLVEQDQMSMQT